MLMRPTTGLSMALLRRRAAGAAAASPYLVQDTFTDDDGTSLDAHTPDVDSVGGGWTVGGGAMDIQSNQAAGNASVVNEAHIDCGASDVSVSADLTHDATGSNRLSGIMARYADTDNYWRVSFYNDEWLLDERVGGSNTQRGAATGVVDGTYAAKLTVSGTSISATYDGANELAYTSSQHQGETGTGLRLRYDGLDTADNFTVEAA